MEPGGKHRFLMLAPTLLVPVLLGQEFQVTSYNQGSFKKVFPGTLQNTLGGSELPSFMQDGNLGIKEESWPLKVQGTWIHLS